VTGRHVSDPNNQSTNYQSGRRLMGLLGILLSAAIVVTLVALLRQDSNDPADQTTTSVAASDTTSGTSGTTSTSAVTTSQTTATTTPTTTTLGDPLAALILNPTGIGDITFGGDADETVAQLSLVLGSPTEDTGWTPSFETCPGTEARVVRWTSLQAFFTNGATEWAPEGTRHFFHYSQSVLAGGGVLIELTTSNGIGIRSTLGELAAAYGEQVTITDDPIFGPFWEVDVAGAGVLWGTAGAIGDSGMIDSINGGSGCGE
jgi:hypothetical protein